MMASCASILRLAPLFLLVGTMACKDVGGVPTGTSDPPAGGAGDGAGAGPRTVVVEITGFAFRGPTGGDAIEVSAGDTLEFVNRDAAPHTATTDAFDSGRLDQGERYRIVVSGAGTLALRCDFHPAMTGTIVVAARGGDAGDPSGGPGNPGGGDPGDPAGGTGDPGGGDPGDPSGGPGNPDGGSGAGSGTVVVDIRDDVFVGPDGSSRIEVPTGSTVRFVNRGGSSHTATSTSIPDGAAAFDSGRMRPGDTFEIVVGTAGTWAFRCDFHDGMTGTLVVADGGPAPPADPGNPGDAGGKNGSGTVVVTINDGGFSDGGNVTLTLGGTVEWVNASTAEHEIDSTDEPDDGAEIESGDLLPGDRYRFTPDRTGVWVYRCKEHDDERGMRIEVR